MCQHRVLSSSAMSSNGHVHVYSVTRADNNETFEIGYVNGKGTFVSKQFARSHTLLYEPKLPTVSPPFPRNETSSSMFNDTYVFNEIDTFSETHTSNATEPTRSGEATAVADNGTARRVVVEVTEAHYKDAGTYACHSRLANVTFLAEVVVLGKLAQRNELTRR